MRRTPLALTLLVTALLLTAVACEPAPTTPTPTTATTTIPPEPPRAAVKKDFGVVVSPWDVDDWSAAVGAKPTSVMHFEAWSRNRAIDGQLAEAKRQGMKAVTVTWEPWEPVPASLGQAAQYAEQPKYSNAAIARGDLDAYIRTFARSVKTQPTLKVFIRYAHEVNGTWYPWSHDPAAFRAAWRRVVDIFRAEGASNARFVFSVNPNMYQDVTRWKATVTPWYPGDGYVHAVGATVINWGASKEYPVPTVVARLKALRALYPTKPVIMTEFQTDYDGRVAWLEALHDWLVTHDADFLIGLNLSQATSRGQAQMGDLVGNLNWKVTADAATKPVVRRIIQNAT